MRRVALFLLCGACLYAQPAALEGAAVNAVTGEPLRGVHIRMFIGGFDGMSSVYGALSGADGRFSITGIEPGSYMLMPKYRGFIYLAQPGARLPGIILKAGQQLTGFKLQMTPEAIITGRVLDEYGDPVAYVQVQPESAAKADSHGMNFRRDSANTDDRGEFHLAVAPGKYRLKASPVRMGGGQEEEIRTDGTSPAVYGTTYYPSALGTDRAGVLEVAAGSEASGIEIRLLPAQRGLTVSGVVSGIPEKTFMAVVMLQSGESAQQIRSSQGRGTGPDGKFTFRNLAPGYYRIYAQQSAGKTELQSPAVEFKLESGDVTNLNLALEPGGELTGTVEIAGASVAKRAVRLEPSPGYGMFDASARSAEVDQNGVFRIADLLPGKYTVSIDPLSENGYVKEMALDGAPAEQDVLDLSRGVHASRVKIVASLQGGQVEGRVLDKDGAPLVNTLATVSLTRNPDQPRPEHFARVTPEGKYTFHGIRPGKYRLVAIDAFHSGSDAEEVRKKAFASAAEIEIKEADRITKDVKVASDNAN